MTRLLADKERDDVAQQLVQSEIGKREISEAHDAVTGRLSDLADENTALRAKVSEMEQQKPVRWGCTVLQVDGSWKEEIGIEKPPKDYFSIRNAFPLYALPGAQSEPESCPCCGEAMRIYSRCRNADCEAVMVTPEQAKYNKVRALMRTCATRLDEPPALSVPEGWIQRGVAELEAIRSRQDDDTLLDDRTLIERIGKAMLAAAPESKP